MNVTPKLILIALSMPIFLVGCGQTDVARLQAAGEAVGQVQAEGLLPDLPADCRRLSFSGVRGGDRLDVAAQKADAALFQQNARTTRCAAWYDQLQAGLRRGAAQ
jgi:hypothetical protein